MKTKELIKKVNVVKGIAACEETHRLTFYEIGQTFPFYTMDKKNVDFGQGDSNFRNLSDTNMSRLSYVIYAIREYLETPLAEREEEASKEDFMNLKVDEKCEWSRESDDVWRSDCGLLWEFDNEETPKANNMNYCPQCGKILEEAPECWEEAE